MIACIILLTGLTACAGKTSETGNESTTQTIDNSAENTKIPTVDVTESDKTESDKIEPGKTETGTSKTENTEADTNTGDTDENVDQNQTGTGKDTLVVVFSATGTTKGVAEKSRQSRMRIFMRSFRLNHTAMPTLTGMTGKAEPL